MSCHAVSSCPIMSCSVRETKRVCRRSTPPKPHMRLAPVCQAPIVRGLPCSDVWCGVLIMSGEMRKCWPMSPIPHNVCQQLTVCFGSCHVMSFLIDWLKIAYTALISALLSRLTALACGFTWVTSFIAHFFFSFNIHQSGVLTALARLVPHETAAISAQVLCTPYNHAPCHFMQSHIRKV